jgi:hypothetical protein
MYISNMTQIIPTRTYIDLALERRILVRRLVSEFDECGIPRRAKKISASDQKKGG